jgi:large conductance mechanosensitive channel
MFKEFKDFAMRGNVIDMAVGIIIGVAFGAIIQSLVKDIIMPPIGIMLGNVDFTNLFLIVKQGTTPGPYASLAQAQAAGAVSINYGVFVNTLINFIIISFCIFLIIRTINRLKKQEPAPAAAPTTKECTYCFSTIPIKALRCPNCTSDLKTAGR